MLKCGICGCEFNAIKERHYISRDEGKAGVVALLGEDEVLEYDTFDCPQCGSQFVAQPRKRRVNEENSKT